MDNLPVLVDDFGVPEYEGAFTDSFFEFFEFVRLPDVVLVGKRNQVAGLCILPGKFKPGGKGLAVPAVFFKSVDFDGQPVCERWLRCRLCS